MVAIHLPPDESADWPSAFEPAPAGAAPVPVTRPARRAVPDRATLYRRRRLAALVLASAVVVGSVGAVGYIRSLVAPDGGPVPIDAGPMGAGPAESPITDRTPYVVQPGDTYWSIAAAIAPDEDPRPIVDQLREASGDDVLRAGDRLVIDVG